MRTTFFDIVIDLAWDFKNRLTPIIYAQKYSTYRTMVVFYSKILITSSKYKTDFTYKDLPDIPGFILASQVAFQNDSHSMATANQKKS